MVAGEQLFSAAELVRLRSWPPEVGSAELVQFFTLAGDDLDWLATAARGATGRRGLAVQLCTLPWLGFVPDDVAAVPVAAATRLASQLGVSRDVLEVYGARAQSRTEHLRLVATRLGWRTAGPAEWKDIGEFLLARAIEHDAPALLFRLACEFCASSRIVRPGPTTLLRTVATAREQATTEVFWRVEPLLGEQRRAELDGLLEVAESLSVSRLAWLHQGATTASPMAIRAELDKLRFLRELDAHQLDMSMLPAARRRRLAGIGRRSRNQALARRDETTRYPVLLATIAECAVEVLDEVVGMFDQAISGVESRARRKLDEFAGRPRPGLRGPAGPARGHPRRDHRPSNPGPRGRAAAARRDRHGPDDRRPTQPGRSAPARSRAPVDDQRQLRVSAGVRPAHHRRDRVRRRPERTGDGDHHGGAAPAGALRPRWTQGPRGRPARVRPDPVAWLSRRRSRGGGHDRLPALLGAVHPAGAA